MNKLICVFLLSFGFILSTEAQIKIYPIDSWHSTIQFTTEFGGMIEVQGTFNSFEGALAFNDQDLMQFSASVIIDVSSIDTNVSLRDTHLKGEDFFGVEKFPQIIFNSQGITRKKGSYYLNGVLEMHGVKRNVSILFNQLSKEKLDPWKNPRVTFTGKLSLNRRDFLIAPSNTNISEEVAIALTISARIFGMDVQGLFKRPFGMEVWNRFKNEGVDAAISKADELYEKEDPDAKRSLSLNFVAMKMEEEGKNEEALKIYEHNAEKFSDKDDVHSNLANAYLRKNQKEKAIEASRKALEINPNNSIALEILKFCKVRKEG